jgi:hypothetical protein
VPFTDVAGPLVGQVAVTCGGSPGASSGVVAGS